MKLTSLIVALAGLAVSTLATATAVAGPFTPGNLVVMRVGSQNTTGSGDVILDEFTTGGAAVGNSIALPTSGNDAISLPTILNNDRHLHRSVDGRFLTFGAYNAAPSATDPSTLTSVAAPRVVALIGANGSADLSNRFTDAYNQTSIRGVYTVDGSAFWMAGDNGGGLTNTGSLRYAAYGASATTNISRTQTTGGTPTTDNVRDLGIFGGQLYDSSGSSASLGRGVFRVGTGLPTSGAPSVTQITPGNISSTSFYFLDLDPNVAGVDTLYSVVGDGLYKYSFNGTTWTARGNVAFSPINNGFSQVLAAVNSTGGVTVYAAGPLAVVSYTDTTSTASITGLTGTTLISAPAGYTLGGIEFTPVPAPGAAAVLVGGALLAARRRRAR